jgi:hypothetical protein
MTKIAKIWVNHQSMSGDPSRHVDYLTNGHQLGADEQARMWTKSLPKACKTDRVALVAHWRGIFQRFVEERKTPGSAVHHNAKVTARQFVINLPNDISSEQVDKLAKAVLLDFPRHIPVSMVLHRTSNRAKRHMHLQGLFSYRNGGYGAIQENFRMNITQQMKNTVAETFARMGYTVDRGAPGGISNNERRWLNQQGTVEQRRNPRFMKEVSKIATSPRLKAYCIKQAEKMARRISAPLPVDNTLQIMSAVTAVTDLSTIYPKSDNSAQDLPRTDRPRGTSEQVTIEPLEKVLTKVKRWEATKKISRSI